MRICLQLLYTEGWVNLAKIIVPNIVNFCRKHGYTWNIQCFPEPCPSDFGYEKLRQIKNIFDNNEADVVWSVDCDLLITRYDWKVEDLINDKDSFYITYGANTYNAGSFIFKKSEFTYWLIEHLLSKQGQDGMHCEQDAICDYIKEFGVESICILPHPTINSFMYPLPPEWPDVIKEKDGNWLEGSSYVLHLPGISMQDRYRILSSTPVIL